MTSKVRLPTGLRVRKVLTPSDLVTRAVAAELAAISTGLSGTARPATLAQIFPEGMAGLVTFTPPAAGWYQIALSDNTRNNDPRCAFDCIVAITGSGTEGSIVAHVTNDSTGNNGSITIVHATPAIAFTQLRLRTVGTQTALDVYTTGSGMSCAAVVANVTAALNGVAAQAGLAPGGGTVTQTLLTSQNGTSVSWVANAAGWYCVATSDNATYADYRCGFNCTVNVYGGVGVTQGQLELIASNDSTGTQAVLTLVHAAANAPITAARLRADGSNHTALDVYVNSSSADIDVEVAPVLGAWNGASAQAGISALGGTVEASLNLDINATGTNQTGSGHSGLAGKFNLLLNSGDFYYGGNHIGTGGGPGVDGINDGATYARVKETELTTGFVKQINDGTTVRNAADIGTVVKVGGHIQSSAIVDGRAEGVGTTVGNIDSTGIVLAAGVDFSRAYTNKTQDNVPDGATYVRGLASEHTLNAWDASKATNANSQNQYLSAVTGTQRNMIPDSDFKYHNVYWSNNGLTIERPSFGGGFANNALAYVGNGSASGYNYSQTTAIPVQSNTTYTVSVLMDATHITTGNLLFVIENANRSTNYLSLVQAAGTRSRVQGTFTTGAGVSNVYAEANTNNATIVNGDAVYWDSPQMEPGSVMTGYRSTDDQNGWAIYTGSGPVTIPQNTFSYTSTTTSIQVSWVSFGWYNADTTSVNAGSGSNTNTTGLASNSAYFFYQYYSTISTTINFPAGGAGSTGYAYPSRNSLASAIQNYAGNVPLSNGGMQCNTTASGTGGGSGGGLACLHPHTAIQTRRGDIQARELQVGDEQPTPDGWQPVVAISRRLQTAWITVSTDEGPSLTVTPSHPFVQADGEYIQAKALKIGMLLKGQGRLYAISKLEARTDDVECVMHEVVRHLYYANGLLMHNGTQKP